ncbi:hypothetical protein B296_00002215 [Ensete ventricosum]|uniref:Uncharacterized protein n=1 Tax=Ensete ventricosum TaxID=4639 RepID=A0A427B4M8_ENSVE|nr:hypothetical protein B296_00002215 [Ensete ventricosum]
MVYTYPERVLPAGRTVDVREAVLVHDPVGLVPPGGLAGVEDEGLLDGHRRGGYDRLVRPGRLPVSRSRRPVRPRPVRVLPVPRREEVPLFLPVRRHPCHDRSRVDDHPTKTTRTSQGHEIKKLYLGVARGRTCRGRAPRRWGRRRGGRRTCGKGSASRAPRPWDGTGTRAAAADPRLSSLAPFDQQPSWSRLIGAREN